jgi:hypothetical protein
MGLTPPLLSFFGVEEVVSPSNDLPKTDIQNGKLLDFIKMSSRNPP